MYCFQCQETAGNTACTKNGVCGKNADTANLQDLLIHVLKAISLTAEKASEEGIDISDAQRFVGQGLFTTITNANFDPASLNAWITQAFSVKKGLLDTLKEKGLDSELPDDVYLTGDEHDYPVLAVSVGILKTEDEDIRSLRELLVIGLKGVAAYAEHAAVLGECANKAYDVITEGLAATLKDKTAEELTALVLKAGEAAVTAMAALDKANTAAYGNPEITEVNIGVRKNPGILISGHDLKDMEELLSQTEGTGVDVYTHGEMLPAHYYPAFKKYSHFAGNYGGSWWKQSTEFASFNGPVILTTNCLTPVKEAYKDRIYTTGVVDYPDILHLPHSEDGGIDFGDVISQAKTCASPGEIETGTIVGGFAHNQVLALADKVVEAVKSGAIKRFIVMAGCDGRQKSRSIFTEVAEKLPSDTVILTAGCAKYRYNKLNLGEIGGIPRVLDAGQCNDSYSLAVTALKLKEVFELEDINDLPISFYVAWYEQKAVAVLLALLHLGVKGIRLGPTLPAFLSPNVAKLLVETFDIKPVTNADDDIEAMLKGQ